MSVTKFRSYLVTLVRLSLYDKNKANNVIEAIKKKKTIPKNFPKLLKFINDCFEKSGDIDLYAVNLAIDLHTPKDIITTIVDNRLYWRMFPSFRPDYVSVETIFAMAVNVDEIILDIRDTTPMPMSFTKAFLSYIFPVGTYLLSGKNMNLLSMRMDDTRQFIVTCTYKGKVTILISPKTSSYGLIVAACLLKYQRGHVLGQSKRTPHTGLLERYGDIGFNIPYCSVTFADGIDIGEINGENENTLTYKQYSVFANKCIKAGAH